MPRIAHAEHHRAALPEPLGDPAQHLTVHRRVAHDAAFADALAAGLELRFHEHEAAVAGAQAF